MDGRSVEVLALCDSELIGRVFKQRGRMLDLETYASFYEGEEVSEGKAVLLVQQAENANIVGEQAVAIAEKAIAFDKKAVKRIAGVPHLQFYRV
jgi:hypothetical protein